MQRQTSTRCLIAYQRYRSVAVLRKCSCGNSETLSFMSVKSHNTSRDFSTLPQVQMQLRESNGSARAAAPTTATLATPALPGLASAGTDHTCVLTPTQGHLQGLLNLGTPFCPWQMHPVYDTGEGHVPQSWESPVLPSQAGLGSDMNLSCSSPVLVPLPRAALEHQQALPEPSLCLGGLARHCHPPETSSLLQTPWVSRGSNPCPAITIRAAQ